MGQDKNLHDLPKSSVEQNTTRAGSWVQNIT